MIQTSAVSRNRHPGPRYPDSWTRAQQTKSATTVRIHFSLSSHRQQQISLQIHLFYLSIRGRATLLRSHSQKESPPATVLSAWQILQAKPASSVSLRSLIFFRRHRQTSIRSHVLHISILFPVPNICYFSPTKASRAESARRGPALTLWTKSSTDFAEYRYVVKYCSRTTVICIFA